VRSAIDGGGRPSAALATRCKRSLRARERRKGVHCAQAGVVKPGGFRGRLEGARLVSWTSADPSIHAGSEDAVSESVGTEATPASQPLPTPERQRPPTAGSFTRERAIQAGLKSAEARRRRREQAAPHRSQQSSPSPVPPDGSAPGPLDSGSHELSGSDAFSARERLRWEAKHSPSATARVSAARALLDEEPRPEVSEPGVSGVPRRGVDLVDVLAVAAAAGWIWMRWWRLRRCGRRQWSRP
jgi:hypothetical protein